MLIFKIPELQKYIFDTTLSVRINDINYGNHLGHDSLISLFHEARMRFLGTIGCTELDIHGCGSIMKNIFVDYISEVFYANEIIIYIGIEGTTRTAVQFLYKAVNKKTGVGIANALTTMIFFDYKKSIVSKIPGKFLEDIEVLSKNF